MATCGKPIGNLKGSMQPPQTIPLITAPLTFHVMTKSRGAICNLDCAYCYLLAKELLYPVSRFSGVSVQVALALLNSPL